MEGISNLFDTINGYLWSPAMLVFILGSCIYLTVRYRFTQVRNIKDMVRNLISSKSSESGISTMSSFWTTMASRVGVGNIAGVALAIYMGGPGAVFWMWVTAIFLSVISFTECAMGQLYKIRVDGEYRGGGYYCAERGLGWKWYGVLFAIICIVANLFLLPLAQANMIAEGMHHSLGIPTWVIGLVGAAAMGIVILGGIRRISGVASILTPLKMGLFIVLTLVLLIVHAREVPQMFGLIFSSAFNQGSVFGGMAGSAISWGIRRATFASGAGMGGEPPAASASEVNHPARQGLANSFGIYCDILICTCSAMMILITDCFNTVSGYIGSGSPAMAELAQTGQSGVVFPQEALGTLIPGGGEFIVGIIVVLCAFTTIMSYSYQAENALAYLLGDSDERRQLRKTLIFVLRLGMLGIYFYASVSTSSVAWGAADTAAGLMVWTNVVMMLLLSPKAIAILRDYEEQRDAGKNAFFDPDKVGIKNADLWKEINKERIAAAKAEIEG